jgi:hypothetical protein
MAQPDQARVQLLRHGLNALKLEKNGVKTEPTQVADRFQYVIAKQRKKASNARKKAAQNIQNTIKGFGSISAGYFSAGSVVLNPNSSQGIRAIAASQGMTISPASIRLLKGGASIIPILKGMITAAKAANRSSIEAHDIMSASPDQDYTEVASAQYQVLKVPNKADRSVAIPVSFATQLGYRPYKQVIFRSTGGKAILARGGDIDQTIRTRTIDFDYPTINKRDPNIRAISVEEWVTDSRQTDQRTAARSLKPGNYEVYRKKSDGSMESFQHRIPPTAPVNTQ